MITTFQLCITVIKSVILKLATEIVLRLIMFSLFTEPVYSLDLIKHDFFERVMFCFLWCLIHIVASTPLVLHNPAFIKLEFMN